MKQYELEFRGKFIRVWAEKLGTTLWFHYNGQVYSHETKQQKRRGAEASVGDGGLLAPMPGKIIKVQVSEGGNVSKGQTLIVLEAMKMEYNLGAAFDGSVLSLNCKEGDQVQQGQLLATVEGHD